MNSTQKTFRLTAISAALMTGSGYAMAGDAQVDELIKPDSSIAIGIGNWSGNRSQGGIYDGMRKQGGYGLLDADIAKRDDATGTWLNFRANNLGLDNREFKLEYLRQGDIGASLEYNRTSRDDPLTFTTRLQGIGTSRQTISSTALPGPLQTVKLGTDRDLVGLGFYKKLMPDLDLTVSFKNEEKKGSRNFSRGSAVEFLAEPIDSTIRQVETTLNYTTKVMQLSGGYYGSWYNTKNNILVALSAGGVAPTYISQPLDNQAHQLFLNAGFSITPSTRGTMKIELTHATQNEHLPMQDVAGLSLAGSPQNLNGAIDTTLVQLGITSRPISQLSLVANLRYHVVKDVTPVNRFVNLGTCATAGNCVDNTPNSYKTLTGKLEATYRLPDGYNLTGGIEQRDQNRSVPVSNALGAGGTDTQRAAPWRAALDETTYRLQLRRSFSETVNGSLAYLNSDRKGSSYVSSATGPAGAASDLINPINIADRERNKLRVAIDWVPMEKASIQFNAEDARDAYPDKGRSFGLKEGTAQLFSLDASYQLNDKWKANAWYSYDSSQAKQMNTRTGSTKDNYLEDTGNSLGFGLRGSVAGNVAVGGDLQWARNVSRYQQTIVGAAQTANMSSDLGDIENTMIKLNLFASYALDKNAEVRFDLIHERWKTNDWTWMFAGGAPFTFGTVTDGTTVTSDPKQSSSFVGARYIYKFQ